MIAVYTGCLTVNTHNACMHRDIMLCSHNTVESSLVPFKSTSDVRLCSFLRILLRPRFGILDKLLLVLLIFPGYASLHRIIGLRL